MGTWRIDKEISFDYGHRVWTQELNEEFSLDNQCVCRHLHGHRAKVHIYLESDTLNDQGMVTDFKHLQWAKKFFDDYIDHKFILDIHDPLYNQLIGDKVLWTPITVLGTNYHTGYLINLNDLGVDKATPEYEYYESFFIVDFVPTSENLSEWACKLIQAKMSKLGVKVPRIDWWETPKSKSTYIA